MHELSIVASIVDVVVESLADGPISNYGARVVEVRLRVGALAAVDEQSLHFCYGIATEGTVLEGSRLVVKHLPITLRCGPCGRDVELPGVQSLRCPECGTLGTDVRQGRELEIESIEIDDGIDDTSTKSDCKTGKEEVGA